MSPRLNVRLLKILVIAFPVIVGSIATLFGVIRYSNTQLFYPEERAVPPGLLVFSSMELGFVNFSMQIIDLDFERGRSDKTNIQCDFDVASTIIGEETIGFQFPYVVEKFEVWGDVEASSIEIIRETVPPRDGARLTEATIVYLKLGRKPEGSRYSIRGFLSWGGLLSRTDYATYKFVVPFARNESALHYSINGVVPDAKIRYLTQSEGDRVSLMINAAAEIKQVYPTPNGVMGFPGYTIHMLSWDLSYPYGISIKEELGTMVDVVVAYFELGSLAQQSSSYLFEAGIYTGLGVSLVFSGLHEALKYLEETKAKKESQQTGG